MLSGISVRHTLARRLARPCDNAYYEQYQWVKQGVIYSVTVTHPDTEAKRTNAEQVELQTVLSGLVSGLEYEPTSAQ